MESAYPQETQSAYAAEGSLAHEVAEKILFDVLKNNLSLRAAFEKHEPLCKDEEMKDAVFNYCDICVNTINRAAPKAGIEKKFVLSKKVDISGTADFAWVEETEGGKRIGTIIDLKYGAGHAVEAEGNPQLACYGAAMHVTKGWGPLDGCNVYIYQPRVEHSKGFLRCMQLSRKELDAWAERLIAAAKKTERMVQGEIPVEYHPGEHCRWCRGEAVCEANRKRMIGDAEIDFAPAKELPAPEVLPPETIAKIILHRSDIESYLKRVDEWALEQMLSGKKIEGLKLVHGRTSRTWKGDVGEDLKALGVEDPYDKKLKGITEIERLIGKGKIDDLTIKPEPKVKVAHASDKREEITMLPVHEDFEF